MHICQEFEKNWEESRQGRVDSWLNFKGVTPKVSAPAAMGPGQARQQPQQLPGHVTHSDQSEKQIYFLISPNIFFFFNLKYFLRILQIFLKINATPSITDILFFQVEGKLRRRKRRKRKRRRISSLQSASDLLKQNPSRDKTGGQSGGLLCSLWSKVRGM